MPEDKLEDVQGPIFVFSCSCYTFFFGMGSWVNGNEA